MNTLKITLNPYNTTNSVSFNGRAVSPFSQLSNFVSKPLLDFADIFFDAVEREINDEYALTVVGESFDLLFLKDMSKRSELCKDCVSESFNFQSSVDKRFRVISTLCSKYSVSCAVENFAIPVYATDGIVQENPLFRKTESENAFLIVTDDKSAEEIQFNNKNEAIILAVSDKNAVSCIGDKKYIWYIEKDRLDTLVQAITERFAKIPYIVEAAKKLSQCTAITAEDKQLVELATSIEPLVCIGNVGRIEVGESLNVEVSTIPADQPLPNIRIESTDNIVNINGLQITGISPGNTQLNIYIGDSIVPFCKRNAEVYQDKTTKKIILDRKEPQMGIGRTQQIDLTPVPADAEDASFIIWSVDNPDIASVNDNGVVTAKKAGRATVTASTQHVKESVIIDVLPNIEQMYISETNIELISGETAPISATYPAAKYFNDTCKWKSSDAGVAVVDVLPNGTSSIRTLAPGECDITYEAEEGGCSISCHVVSVDPEEAKRKEAKKFEKIDLLCMIGIPIAIVITVSILAFLISLFK